MAPVLHEYKVGNLVMVKRIPKSSFVGEVVMDNKRQKTKILAALQDRYKGPYRVSKIISPKTIVCVINGREQPMAYKNLKPYHSAAFRKFTGYFSLIPNRYVCIPLVVVFLKPGGKSLHVSHAFI